MTITKFRHAPSHHGGTMTTQTQPKATCNYCNQEMTTNNPCTITEYNDFPDGITRQRTPFTLDATHCHDCGTPHNGLHHPGCDAEKCPACGGQAISCSCTDAEEDEDW